MNFTYLKDEKRNYRYIFEILKITIPAVVSVGVVMLTRWLEKKKEYENQIREKKIVIYESFVMNTLSFLLKSPSLPKKHTTFIDLN